MKKLSVNSLTSSTSSSRTSVSKHQKSYLTIDNLIRMFREKSKSFDLRQHQKSLASSQSSDTRSSSQSRFSFMHQSRIIVYFLSAANQKTSISQISKSPNSKSFQQHTFAKSIRSAFTLPEKSIISPYKKTNIFYISLQSKFSSRFSFAWPRSTSSPTSSPIFRSRISNHVCCICFDHFSSRNDPFSYRRPSQSYFSNRRPMRKVKRMINRFEAKLKKNEK